MANLNVKAVNNNRQLAFHYTDYNWFITGSFISRTGDWFDRVALNWYVFTLTNSVFYIGLVEFCRLIPILFFSIIGGIVADKWERRKVLIATQAGTMLATIALGFVILQEGIYFGYVAACILIRGVFLAFEIPARNAMIPNLVPKEAMVSAVSFFSAVLNTSRIVGPALAGFLLTKWSAPALIFGNALSFLAVIGTLLLIRPKEASTTEFRKDLKVSAGIKEAFQYLKDHPMMLGVFILGIVPMIFGYPYTTVAPVFAKELLQVGSEGFGMLLSFAAMGSVICSLWLGWGKYSPPKGWFLIGCICSFGAGIILFSLSRSYEWSLFIMFFIGMASQGYRIIERVIIQKMIPDHMRGRILSIVMMDSGLVPLGGLLIGFLGERIGVVAALCIMGSICVITACAVVAVNKNIVKIT